MKNSEKLRVAQEYRTNPLSYKKTNTEVEVEFESGHCFIYDNIHKPYKYVNAIEQKNHIEYGKVVSMKINGQEVDYYNQIDD
tara:strand:+ start:169 stop:414 length:246 start_codon:yes stop_codon:yes gene_type:complete